MTLRTAGEGFHHSLFTWHPHAKMFTIEISTLSANCKNGVPFLLVDGRVAVRIVGKKSTKDFLWSYNVFDQENDMVAAVYTNGDLELHILND